MYSILARRHRHRFVSLFRFTVLLAYSSPAAICETHRSLLLSLFCKYHHLNIPHCISNYRHCSGDGLLLSEFLSQNCRNRRRVGCPLFLNSHHLPSLLDSRWLHWRIYTGTSYMYHGKSQYLVLNGQRGHQKLIGHCSYTHLLSCIHWDLKRLLTERCGWICQWIIKFVCRRPGYYYRHRKVKEYQWWCVWAGFEKDR